MIQNRPSEIGEAKKDIAFGQDIFHQVVMEKMLPRNVWSHLKEVIHGRTKLNPLFVPQVAAAMKEWAVKQGATHFCHWFQPLTGLAAEKHDAFIDWDSAGELIEKFSGAHLMRGEPDASSFPHGGLRSTAEARGYTAWDPTSFPFLWGMGSPKVLCIPSIFFSWTGKALDTKIPLMRSEGKVEVAALRLLHLLGIEASSVRTTLGVEQEYFLVDRAFYLLRPDLLFAGRTLCGGEPAKGQEFEDHYFGPMKARVSSFTLDLEQRAFALGIPLKTRHAEVAPGQYEVAPLFEKASTAVDHNSMLMELMRQVATKHHLVCLFHEKPFARINGSGKHCNWSLSTDTGVNLLDPKQPELIFLTTLTAVIHAVHQHAALLRASIATAGNDHRLGGHEAPPALISIFLGEALEKWVRSVEEDKAHQSSAGQMLDLFIPPLPPIALDEADRNRTSPFAFTGNKFEFRAVGASQHCAEPMTVLNAIVASSMNCIVDDMEKEVIKGKSLKEAAIKIVRKYLKASKAVRFTGDNYSASWHREAKRRKLPLFEKSVYAFDVFLQKSTLNAFEGILSQTELEARVEIMRERYCKMIQLEARLFVDLFQTQILPVSFQYQKEVAESVKSVSEMGHAVGPLQTAQIKKIAQLINGAIDAVHLLEKSRQKASQGPLVKRGLLCSDVVSVHIAAVRKWVDELEEILDDRLWPLPKYREMLHIL
jgi:glutamine synthetase